MTQEELNELIEQLGRIGERVPTPCPDGIKGCLGYHIRIDTDPVCAEATTQLQALAARVKVLEGLLREAEVKLTDVQGAYATGQYAANLLARISAALKGTKP